MKRKIITVYGKKFTILVCTILALTITGCSEKSEESGIIVEGLENQDENGQEDNLDNFESDEKESENGEGGASEEGNKKFETNK